MQTESGQFRRTVDNDWALFRGKYTFDRK